MSVEIEKIWNTEIEILDVLHKILTENHLRYSLGYGTLLGAVRHNGFIPWDDDIDLMMPREDYERLYDIWDSVAPEGYIMETEDNTSDLPINHMKIRKDHTTFLQDESEKNKKYHKGIFVDIFPGDRKAPGFVQGKLQFAALSVHLLYNRGFAAHKEGLKSIPEKILLSVPEKYNRTLSRKFGKISRRWNKQKTGYLFPCTLRDCRVTYPSDLFDHLILKEFNGKQYYVFQNYDEILRLQYGDYMQLPPEEERVWKHHPLIVDFNHNYEELKDQQIKD